MYIAILHHVVMRYIEKGKGGNKVSKLHSVGLPHYSGSADKTTRKIPAPETVAISMAQHIGAPCEPLVKVGDKVKVGQKIGDTGAFMSAPVPACVSGVLV